MAEEQGLERKTKGETMDRGQDQRDRLKLVMVGHVDHGKSTLIGRLLADTDSLEEGKMEKVQRICEEQHKSFEYAFLLDALEEEQLQGITIDTTQIRFQTESRQYLIIDAPGHKEFLKNMISGAANAEAAFLIIDADEGVQEQSKRHCYLLSLLGIQDIVVIVNKMDLVDYSREKFENIKKEYSLFLEDIGVVPIHFLPISAKLGENVTETSEKMSWFDGPSVLEFLEGFERVQKDRRGDLRLYVQDVYKFDDKRIVAGRIESGKLAVGDEIQVWPTGHSARIKTLEHWPEDEEAPLAATAGESVGVTLDYQLFVDRGNVLTKGEGASPHVSNFLRANIFWIHPKSCQLNRHYKLKLNTFEGDVEIFNIKRVLDASTLEMYPDKTQIPQNDVAEVILRSEKPVVFDTFDESSRSGRFVLMDGYDVAGGGIILEADPIYDRRYKKGLPKSENISPKVENITHKERSVSYGHKGHVIWLTGVPGAGKSTLGRGLERHLFEQGIKTFLIEGENLRFGLSSDLGFSEEDRREQTRRAGEVAHMFKLAGIVSIVGLVSPYREDREYVRSLITPKDFTQVYLHAPKEVVEKRDPNGIYSKVKSDPTMEVSGWNAPYEAPVEADFVFDTSQKTVDEVCGRILEGLLEKLRDF